MSQFGYFIFTTFSTIKFEKLFLKYFLIPITAKNFYRYIIRNIMLRGLMEYNILKGRNRILAKKVLKNLSPTKMFRCFIILKK